MFEDVEIWGRGQKPGLSFSQVSDGSLSSNLRSDVDGGGSLSLSQSLSWSLQTSLAFIPGVKR